MINWSNISYNYWPDVQNIDCSLACKTCADATMRSINSSHWIVIAALGMLVLSRWKSVEKVDNFYDNVGLILLAVVSLFWLIGLK